jgi:acetoin utilization protein AcuB
VIISDIMTTQLVTVAPDDTLARAISLFRQHHFHHLPVARTVSVRDPQPDDQERRKVQRVLAGVLTSQDIDLQAALARQNPAAGGQQPWQERLVAEVMHRGLIRVTPTTSVAAAAQILVERNLTYLPVVEYAVEQEQPLAEQQAILVGLVTRSDLLMALSRATGAFEPGMQLNLALPLGDMSFLARTLLLAAEVHISVRSVLAVPVDDGVPRVATLRLGTINPAPLLMRLQKEGIQYSFGNALIEGE